MDNQNQYSIKFQLNKIKDKRDTTLNEVMRKYHQEEHTLAVYKFL